MIDHKNYQYILNRRLILFKLKFEKLSFNNTKIYFIDCNSNSYLSNLKVLR